VFIAPDASVGAATGRLVRLNVTGLGIPAVSDLERHLQHLIIPTLVELALRGVGGLIAPSSASS
jgi:hypothetical protein